MSSPDGTKHELGSLKKMTASETGSRAKRFIPLYWRRQSGVGIISFLQQENDKLWLFQKAFREWT